MAPPHLRPRPHWCPRPHRRPAPRAVDGGDLEGRRPRRAGARRPRSLRGQRRTSGAWRSAGGLAHLRGLRRPHGGRTPRGGPRGRPRAVPPGEHPRRPWYAFGTLDLHARVDTSPGLLVALSRLSETVTKGNGPRPGCSSPWPPAPSWPGIRSTWGSASRTSPRSLGDRHRARERTARLRAPRRHGGPYRGRSSPSPTGAAPCAPLMVAAATRLARRGQPRALGHVALRPAPWRPCARGSPWRPRRSCAHDLAGLLTTDGAPRREPYAPPFRARTTPRLAPGSSGPGALGSSRSHHGILFAESAGSGRRRGRQSSTPRTPAA